MRIVIVGGGFCGSLVAKELDKSKNISVVLIDKKEYFEYSPSIWKLLIHPKNHNKYKVPYAKFLRNTRIIQATVTRITPLNVQTEKECIPFDYLVISTGIEYPIFLENKTDVIRVKSGNEVIENRNKIRQANTLLIVGGGLIGTEVAGELGTQYPEKQFILIHSHNRLLERNTQNVSEYAKKFLEARGIKIILNEKVVDHHDNCYSTNTHRVIKADMAIWCAGITSDPWFMNTFPPSIYTDDKALKVNHFLQLEGYSNIFVGGDITAIREEKTALNAERHGNLIVSNLQRAMKKRKLIAYTSRKLPMIINLGRNHAVLTIWMFMLPGFLPALIKLVAEKIGIKRLSL